MASPGFIAACCLGNRSIFIDPGLPHHHHLLQEEAVSSVSLTFGALSTVGLFVVLYPWRCARQRSPRRLAQHLQGPNLIHVVYCIITAALLGNIGIIIRSCLWLHKKYPGPRDKAYGDFKHIFCGVSSVWVQYCFLAGVFWHLCYSIEAYMVSHGTTSSRWMLHIIGWVCPSFFVGLGTFIAYSPGFSSCGAQDPVEMGVLYILILVPVIIVFLLNTAIFYKASASVKRSLIHHFGRYSTEERKTVDGIKTKFILFSITYLICWLPNLLESILINVLNQKSSSVVLVMLVLESVLNPCEVLLLIMVLWGCPPAVRCKKTNSSGYEEISRGTINSRTRSKSSTSSRLFVSWSRARNEENDPLISFSRTPVL